MTHVPRLPAHFALLLAAAVLVSGCSGAPVRRASGLVPAQPLATLQLPEGSADGRASCLRIASSIISFDLRDGNKSTCFAVSFGV